MNSWLRMNTCSWASTWPRSAVSTGPRTVSTLGMARRYAGAPPLSAGRCQLGVVSWALSAGEVEEARQVVAHHRLHMVVAEVLELAQIGLRLGEPFAVGEVGAE